MCNHSTGLNTLKVSFLIADHSEVDGDKRVCEDSSRHVCEKTRARLLQSSRFHDLCRFISLEG